MAQALTTNAKGWQRIGRMLVDYEGAPLQALRKQRRWPIMGPSKGKRVYITQDDGSGNPTPIFRGSHPDGFTCADRLDGDGEITVFATLMKGAAFTGQMVTVQKIKLPTQSEAKWQVISTGELQWEAEAMEDIIDSGVVPIQYWREEIYTEAGSDDVTGGEIGTCEVVAKLFNTASPIASGSECWVEFRQNVRTFETPDMRVGFEMFIVIPRNCPDYQTEV